MSDLTREALDVEDLRRMARRRLTKALFEFCDRGGEDEIAMRDNRAALERMNPLPRGLLGQPASPRPTRASPSSAKSTRCRC